MSAIGHDQFWPKFCSNSNSVWISDLFKVSFRQLQQDLEGVDELLVHFLDLVLVGHVDHVDHNKF